METKKNKSICATKCIRSQSSDVNKQLIKKEEITSVIARAKNIVGKIIAF